VQIRASCWSVQERDRRRFWTFSLPVLSNIAAAVSDETKGFKVGVKGRVQEGMYPSRWGPGGCAFGKASRLQVHAGEF
jgi:hypothetical protein